MARPTGVTVLGFLGAIGGSLAILGGAVLAIARIVGAHRDPPPFITPRPTGGIILMVLGAFNLMLGIGLLRLANWARILVMVFAAISVFGSLMGILRGLAFITPAQILQQILVIAINALILWYLSRPHVRAAFAPGAAAPQAPAPPATPATFA